MPIIEVPTTCFEDQKPGTSGLRKKVAVFKQPNYTENLIQAILNGNSKVNFLVIGGDGRYYSDEVIRTIISICAANNFEKLIIGQNGILSTPAASALIREVKAQGGIILTASHNPGGPDGDFGIKVNSRHGGPSSDRLAAMVNKQTKIIQSYKTLSEKPIVDLSKVNVFQVESMKVAVVDPVFNYLETVSRVFDFNLIGELLNSPKPIKILVDCMNGVMGPYAKRILCKKLKAPESSIINAEPLPDFGGLHPDPNLTYAKDLVDKLKADPEISFGIAFDGDGDRNMVLGEGGFFVSPGDALAIIMNNSQRLAYFRKKGYWVQNSSCSNKAGSNVARSFPTSPAVDRVAEKFNVKVIETPTGWKYFVNLMEDSIISLCGEESFGIGSDHIREKDGMWACLAWLEIMAHSKKSIKELVEDHWKEFGRDYFCRYDFENCDAKKCQAMVEDLDALYCGTSLIGKKYGSKEQYVVKESGNFDYSDQHDKSVALKQGLFVKFENGARMVTRLSGTGSEGGTIRLYISDYSRDNIFEDSQVYLKELFGVALELTKLSEYTGRSEPTVTT